ncbi:class I SAM-dependent methyltransferase [Clostridium sp. D2Q-11]|uniref:Class I SAM-dependent methyltransferase n=1 Tax=Anaeromonas frigoriresistens TaxID=2683708 RepID=A0A942Z7C1_9FIRM|nr:class I SAM-dependent methyltransferase [Anaeromonas frigoriresistens]MBS4539406.1 class I SAM-dependent methyltransferase [Anaeromonas frigoriresistens]
MKEQKDFFNKVAKDWDEICKHDMKKVEFILDLIDIDTGSHILDVGTGTGVLIPSLYQQVTNSGYIKAIDVSEKMIEVARQKNKYENIIFKCGDVLETNEDQNSYDHVICYSMFPHFQSRKREAIVKLSQKLKVGGKLTICHSKSRETINNLHKKAEDTVKEDNLPKMEIIIEYFLEAGLKVVKEIDNEEMFVIIGLK